MVSLFRSFGEVIETIIFIDSSIIFGILSRIRKFLKFRCFSGFS